MNETFIKQAPNRVVSSLGYSVETLGRVGVHYVDQKVDIVIDVEGLAIDGYGLYTSSLHADEAEVSRIVGNVQNAFSIWGLKLYPT